MSAYWERRAQEREVRAQKNAEGTILRVAKAYDKAIENINAEIDKIFGKFAKDGDLTTEEAKKLLNTRETKAVIEDLKSRLADVTDEDVRRELLSRINAMAYAARISRLEAVREKVHSEVMLLADVERRLDTEHFIDAANMGYYSTIFDFQQEAGTAFDFALYPRSAMEQALRHQWSGKNFSERVWKNTAQLAIKAQKVIEGGIQSGTSIAKMSRELEALTDLGKYAATRLVRTETNYYVNQGTLAAYIEEGTEKYRYLATLDLRTSDVCADLDNTVHEVEKAEVGKNYPPMHPNCRSTVTPDIENRTGKRIARDPETGKTYHIDINMTYKEWYQKYVVEEYGADRAEAMKKMIVNKSADKAQHERYKQILGKEIPKSLDKFQELKYNDSKKWGDLKGLYKYLNKYPSSDKRYYEINRDLKAMGIKNGVALPPSKIKPYILPSGKHDQYHVMKRMAERHITDDEVRQYVKDARVMFNQWNGERKVFYSDDGVTVVIKSDGDWIARTAWNKPDFDSDTDAILEVTNRYVK